MIKKSASYLLLTVTLCVLLFVSFSSIETTNLSKYSTQGLALNYTVNQYKNASVDVLPTKKLDKRFSPILGKSFVGFKEALAFKESRGDYFVVNSLGYLGKYQFGAETLKIIGIHNPTLFLKNPELQEKAFIANTSRNKWILRHDIKNFVGKKINDVLITESGILAAAHLSGAGSVKNYLRSYGIDNFEDGFGTTISYYMKRFSGYDTALIIADKKAKAI